ncbi:MAG: TIGR04086 family membrane protein [Clostridiaceae bacterium]|nr:TIGR04086 family membrane protein [Clostridiaceae bacterium]
MENLDKNELKQNTIRILKGSITSIILTLILLFVFSIILTYTSVQENTINPVIIIITAISILVGSSISTLKIKKNGLLNGALVGIIYIFTIYIISSIAGAGFSINLSTIIMIIASIIAGMLGGIIGVNL